MEGVPVCIGLEVGKEKRRKKGKKKKNIIVSTKPTKV